MKRTFLFLLLTSMACGTPLWNSPSVYVTCDAYAQPLGGVRIQMAEDAEFTAIVVDQTLEAALPAHAAPEIPLWDLVKDLPDGTYYLRAQVLSVSLTPSPWGDTVVVEKDWAPPPKPSGCAILRR